MARQIQIRRGTTAQHAAFTGAPGEVTMDTGLKTLRVHDGTTVGGTIIARKSDIPTNQQISNIASPSAQYTDITIGAHGTYYTAPSDGWFTIWMEYAPQGKSIGIRNAENNIGYVLSIGSGNGTYYVSVPVSSGQRAQAFHYNITPTGIRFIPANGQI